MEQDVTRLREKWPLPDGYADADVNRVQLALAMQVSENTITKWASDPRNPMPVREQGGNGREYVFSLADCYAWRRERDDAEASAQAEADAAAAAMSNLFLNLEEGAAGTSGPLSAKQVKEHSEAEIRRLQANEMRGDLLRREQVEIVMTSMLEQFKRTVVTLADYLELEFSLAPDDVAKVQARCDDALIQVQSELLEIAGRGLPPGGVVAFPDGASEAQGS